MRHVELDRQDELAGPNGAARGLAVFLVMERAAHLVDEAIAGIARGVEVLAVVPLTAGQRATLAASLGPSDRGLPTEAGGPHTLVVACDVPPPSDTEQDRARTDRRLGEVRRHSLRRVLRTVAPKDAFEALRHLGSGRAAIDVLDLLGDAALTAGIVARVHDLAQACAVPFPLVRMLAPDSPGFRARVALVDHPVHGTCVCKIFRPGARAAYDRELHARRELGDHPLVPRLLDAGGNWLLTPQYTDDGSHLLRTLPGVPEMHQLRPAAARALAGFTRVLHDRGLFVLDLSPHNLMSDPVAGLKVIDLEFVMPYSEFPGPPPPASGGSWSIRGVPASMRTIDLPDLPLTRRVGNAVFHPAIAGLPVESLLRGPRPGDGVRRVATQWAWWATMATAGRLHAAVRRRREA